MRVTLLCSLTLLAQMSVETAAYGGWGRRGCGPSASVGAYAPSAQALSGWQQTVTSSPDHAPCWIYWENGQATRAYVPVSERYCIRHGQEWVDQETPDDLPLQVRPAERRRPRPKPHPRPEPPKGEEEEAIDTPPIFGVEEEKLSGREKFTINNKEVSRKEFFDLINAAKIPEDAHLPRLTIIGSEVDRLKVLTDLDKNPALGALKGKLAVQDYDPAHWAVATTGFVLTGQPGIYLQQPDGKVLLRLDEYDGPEKLAEQIRKADPNYNPKADPSGKPKPQPAGPDTAGVPLLGWLGIAGAAVVVIGLFRKR